VIRAGSPLTFFRTEAIHVCLVNFQDNIADFDLEHTKKKLSALSKTQSDAGIKNVGEQVRSFRRTVKNSSFFRWRKCERAVEGQKNEEEGGAWN
jgi:hypothetical protein